MKLVKFALFLLAGFLSPAYADQYQDAIDKAFPGYRILGPSEVGLDKNGMNQDLYSRVKDHPGLALGDFNSDKIKDFAAIIRGSTKRIQPADPASKRRAMDYYDGFLVVCYGRAQGDYDCHKMHSGPTRVFLPHRQFVGTVPPREQYCLELERFRLPKRRPDPNLGFDPDAAPESSVRISLRTDAIGLFQTSGLGDVIYVYRPDGIYLECTVTD